MKLIDPKQVRDVQSLRDIAETYKLSFESAVSRAGELEFEVTDYKRAYGNMSLDRDGLRAQVAQLTARVLELEEALAPTPTVTEPVIVDAAVAFAPKCAEHPDGCLQFSHGKIMEPPVPLQAPAEDVPAPVAASEESAISASALIEGGS